VGTLGVAAARHHPQRPRGRTPVTDYALAVDLGGTKVEAALVDSAGGLLAGSRHRRPTGAGSTSDELAAAVTEAVRDALAALPAGATLLGAGIGSAGPIAGTTGDVSPLNLAAWRDYPLGGLVAATLTSAGFPDRPVTLRMDGICIAVAEVWLGAAQGETNVMGMIVSTGVGGGLIRDGRLLDGHTGNSGHIGHVCVAPGGRRCKCGAYGCLEAQASGTAIAEMTGRPAAEASPAVIEQTGIYVGRAVASVAVLLDLRLAVIGGSVALGFGAPFYTAVQAEVDRQASIKFSRGVQVRPAGLGADAPLVGAAAVARRHVE